MPSATELREIALRVAVLYDKNRALSTDELLNSAEMFYEFLTGNPQIITQPIPETAEAP